MVGGTMLLCAVGAMLLIALWSLQFDELPDAEQRDGLLALRSFAKKTKRNRGEPVTRTRAGKQAAPRRNVTAKKPRLVQFDPDEMAEIAEEAEANLPAFLRESREEY